jgi:hypothetical protein
LRIRRDMAAAGASLVVGMNLIPSDPERRRIGDNAPAAESFSFCVRQDLKTSWGELSFLLF